MRIAHAEECEIGSRNHQCVYCHQLFLSKGALTYHIIRYHRNVLKKSCDICDLKFEYFHELTKHMQIKHTKPLNGKPMTCHICKKLFRNRETLRTHIYRHKNCDGTCYKVYLDQNNFTYLKSKRVCVHKKNNKTKITCMECFKEMPSSFALKRHAVIHSINYKYCRFCNINYENVEKLKRHFMKCHSKETCFHCDYCNLELSTFRNMMNHRKSQRHRKQYWLVYRKNIQTNNKSEEEDEVNNEFIKEVIVVVPNIKSEPVDDSTTNNYEIDFHIKPET